MEKLRTFSPTNRLALQGAFITFLLGTTLCICTLIIGFEDLMGIGIVFLICSFIINSFLVIWVLIRSVYEKPPMQEIIVTLYLSLLNIPIGVSYIVLLTS